jgi:uroporphyrinogen decarboxylase
VDYASNPGIDRRLKSHFGLDVGDNEGLRRALGVDFRYLSAPYTGPELHVAPPDRKVDLWGAHQRWIEHATGGYWDFCDFPLRDADESVAKIFPLPDPDNFDYESVSRGCQEHGDYFLAVGGAGIPDIINSTGRVRSMEQTLIDLVSGEPVSLIYIDRRIEITYTKIERELEAGGGRIDCVCLGEDLGTQIGPMISLELFRSVFRPRIQKFIDLAKRFDAFTMIHCCGSSSWAFDDFVEMGIDVVDTLQPEAAHMSPSYLKSTFGNRLAFHGCISTAGPVATGTIADVEENIRDTLRTMMPGGGYCLAPTHQLQDNTPTENAVRMYELVAEYGVY